MIEVGTVLHETYRIDKVLGQGGMGAVYQASHVRLPKKFAIKVLHPDALKNPDAYARFRREAEITSSIGHPNIVEVQDWNQIDGQPYLVMEYLDGTDLGVLLKRGGALAPERALAIAKAIASALGAAHAADVVHRDLKPANIFLSKKGGQEVIKIVDFGISKLAGATDIQTKTTDVIGTPAYMSPEQARGKAANVDGRADQFSLATMCYEMLSGRRAFLTGGDDSLYAIIYRIVNEDPKAWPGASEAVMSVLWRGMSKTAEERYPNVAEFAQALEDAIAGRPVVGRVGSPSELSGLKLGVSSGGSSLSAAASESRAPAAGSGKQSPWLLIAGAVAVVALAAVVAVALAPKKAAPPPLPTPVIVAKPVTAPTPPAAPAKVLIHLALDPQSARATLDGAAIPGNSLELLQGSAPRKIRVEAEGYEPAEISVKTDADQDLDVKLVAKAAATVAAPPVPTKSSHSAHSAKPDPAPKAGATDNGVKKPEEKEKEDDLENPFSKH